MLDYLFSPYILTSKIILKNKIVMAPMTRRQSSDDHTPSKSMVDYYARRSDAGLIITEGTLISRDAIGYGNVPGIFTHSHMNAWREITNAVHKKNGYIFLQLWHCGRISHSNFHNGNLPISASSTQAKITLGSTNLLCSPSKEASILDIKQLILEYSHAAENAIMAGFDGVEIHGANGYLIDQFLHYSTNQRKDEYGITPENMARFPLEVVHACGQTIGYDRVGIRLSPASHMNDITPDNNDKYIFEHFLTALSHLKLAYIHTGNFDDSVKFSELNDSTMTEFLRKYYTGALIASGGYDLNKAAKYIHNNEFDLIAIGRPFIANHNLIELVKNQLAIIPYQPEMLQRSLY